MTDGSEKPMSNRVNSTKEDSQILHCYDNLVAMATANNCVFLQLYAVHYRFGGYLGQWSLFKFPFENEFLGTK